MKKIIFLFLISCAVSAKGFSQVDPKTVQEHDMPEPPPPTYFIKDSLFSRVEQEAAFPGGLEAFKRYLEMNLNAMVPVNRNAPFGNYTVIVRFIVNKDGSITDVFAQTNKGYGMEEEVIRIIKLSPNWIPARVNEKPVRAFRQQPIVFQVTKG